MSVKVSLSSTGFDSGHDELKEKERRMRREASRLVSMANKRLKRLEEQNLLNTPAYKSWFDSGGKKFGIRGKTNKQVQHEMARINKFLKMQTSTVTGAKQNLKDIASRINIYDWDNFEDLNRRISNYYMLTDRVLEYSRTLQALGTSLNYEKVGEVVADYMQEVNGQVTMSDEEVVMLTQKVAEAVGNQALSDELDKLAEQMENMLGF